MITFNAVTKAFGDDLIALQDISFTIEPGELVVITGHSGSGKTTLMRLLTKEYEPTSGEIIFNGQPLQDIKGSQVHHHRRQIGVVFQDYKLLPELNVWENIALSLYITGQKQAEIEQRVTDLLRLISLDDKPFLFPSQLSGGEAQRVSIARALATAPSVIFADEPTGNLDADTSAAIARLLQKINKLGTTVLIATHDVSVLDLMQKERHMHLEHGKLVKDEKASETVNSKSKKLKASELEETVSKTEVEPLTEVITETDLPSEATESKPSLISKIWPFGKKRTVQVLAENPAETEIEIKTEVIELGPPQTSPTKTAPAEHSAASTQRGEKTKPAAPKGTPAERSSAAMPSTASTQGDETKTVTAASHKPTSNTKIDDKNAEVKVENL